MKKFIKPLIINPDLIISLMVFVPLFLLVNNTFVIVLIYSLTCLLLGPITFSIIGYLERKFSVFDRKEIANPVLVLGGGHTPDVNLPSNQQLTSGAMGRVFEGLRVFHSSNSKTLVLSGPSLSNGHPSQAEIQENMLLGFGSIAPQAITRLDQPTTTEEEVISYQNIFGNISPILVTKAIHMPRAMKTFHLYGIHPVPAPCNFVFKEKGMEWNKWIIPAFTHTPFLGELLKEAFGILFLLFRSSTQPKQVLSKA